MGLEDEAICTHQTESDNVVPLLFLSSVRRKAVHV